MALIPSNCHAILGQLGLWEVSRSRPADCSPPSWPFCGRSGRKDISPQRAPLPTLE